MRVCLLALEFFGWNRFGGVGKVTRELASGLAERGVEVSVVVPQARGMPRSIRIDGVDVHCFKYPEIPLLLALLNRLEADVYHSQGLTPLTALAKLVRAGGKHVVTFQNPRTREDWSLQESFYPPRRLLYNRFVEPALVPCVSRLDGVYCHARYLVPKVKDMYGLGKPPGFLPNPVRVPSSPPRKSGAPVVVFLGRLDPVKNPGAFCRLALSFPEAQFYVAGKGHSEAFERHIRGKFSGVRNLSFLGFVDGVEKEKLLDRAWVLVNTSFFEALPVSFLEAAAHGCAILSPFDPDGFASRFGVHCPLERLREGLEFLLEGDAWYEKGLRGFKYVRGVHEYNSVVERHLSIYERLLGA